MCRKLRIMEKVLWLVRCLDAYIFLDKVKTMEAA